MRQAEGGRATVYYGQPTTSKPKKPPKPKPGYTVKVTSENSGYNVKGHRSPNKAILKKAISGGYNKKKPVAKKPVAHKTVNKQAAKHRVTTKGKVSASGARGGTKGSSGSASKGKSSTPKYTGQTAADYKKAAEDAVRMMLQPKLDAITREITGENNQYAQGQGTINTQRDRTLTDLAKIYANIQAADKGNQQQVAQVYQGAQQAQGQTYDQLGQALQGIYGQQQGAASSELARMGLTGSTTGQDQMQSDASFLQGMAQTQKAAQASLLQQQAASGNALAGAMTASDQAQGATRKNQTNQSAADALTQLLNQHNNQLTDLNSQYASISSQRGDLVNQYMQQMEQQAYERMMQAQQQDFLNQMSVNKFNLDNQRYQSDQAYKQAELALRAAGNQSSASAQKVQGLQGAYDYLDKYAGSSSAANALKSIFQHVDAHTRKSSVKGQPRNVNDWSQYNYADSPYILQYMYNYLDDPGFSGVNNQNMRNILSNALRAYFGKI